MLIGREDCCLVVVDVQERLLPAMAEPARLVARCRLLLEAASRLGVPVLFTEHNPAGIGRVVGVLRELAPQAPVVEKMAFASLREPAFADWLARTAPRQAVVCGIESHVCVLQTAMAMIGRGPQLFVVADAVDSRRPEDRAAALARLARAGVEPVTAEMVVFEWLGRGDDPAFKALLPAIRSGGEGG